jgi:hypothetical protein
MEEPKPKEPQMEQLLLELAHVLAEKDQTAKKMNLEAIRAALAAKLQELKS